VYLDVPYSEKDEAKRFGARWDQAARRWYDSRPPTPALQRWAARPEVPELLPGEDRSFGQGLFVDLVPSSCWFTNVRWCVTEADWERLRRPIVRRAEGRCEACGAERGQRVEVHERWHYDYDRSVQSLRRLVALCPACHSTTHFGHAAAIGRDGEARAHLQAVTGMTDDQAREHITAAYERWAVRSAMTWELDLSVLTGASIQPRRPPAAEQRADVAEHELAHVRAEAAGRPADRLQHAAPAAPTPVAKPSGAPPAKPPSGMPGGDADLAQLLADTRWHGGPDDVARNAPGIGITHEATRRRETGGAGADRSWRLGADGEATVAEILHKLTTPSRLDRLRRRPPAWHVLHSVPIGTGRGDIDHVLIGPPGVVTINTKHHRAGRLALDGEQLVVNGRTTDYIPKARREAERAATLLTAALTATGHPELAAQLPVRPVLAIVGGRVLVTQWTPGVAVVMTRELLGTLTAMPDALDPTQVGVIYDLARHRAVWTRPAA